MQVRTGTDARYACAFGTEHASAGTWKTSISMRSCAPPAPRESFEEGNHGWLGQADGHVWLGHTWAWRCVVSSMDSDSSAFLLMHGVHPFRPPRP
eukprot:8118841-Pyramimonas_sp.AAC.1